MLRAPLGRELPVTIRSLLGKQRRCPQTCCRCCRCPQDGGATGTRRWRRHRRRHRRRHQLTSSPRRRRRRRTTTTNSPEPPADSELCVQLAACGLAQEVLAAIARRQPRTDITACNTLVGLCCTSGLRFLCASGSGQLAVDQLGLLAATGALALLAARTAPSLSASTVCTACSNSRSAH